MSFKVFHVKRFIVFHVKRFIVFHVKHHAPYQFWRACASSRSMIICSNGANKYLRELVQNS